MHRTLGLAVMMLTACDGRPIAQPRVEPIANQAPAPVEVDARTEAIAFLRAGNFRCERIVYEDECAERVMKGFEPVSPDATSDDPCLRREQAMQALDQLHDADLPHVDDALDRIVALPRPEHDLSAHVFAIVPPGDDARRLRLIAAALAGGRDDLADEAIAGLTPDGAARALVELHRERAVSQLQHPDHAVVIAALAHGLSTEATVDLLAMVTSADLADAKLAAALRAVAADADCAAAAAAATLLVQSGDASAAPGATPPADEAAALRALCVAGHMDDGEFARVVMPLLPPTPVALVETVIDPDGHARVSRDTIQPAGSAAAIADYVPRSIDDTGVWIQYPRSVAMTFDRGAHGLTLRTIETTFTAAGCGC